MVESAERGGNLDPAGRPVAGVLVGGSSRRMGSPKELLPHPHSGTFVEHVVNVARAVTPDVILLGKPGAMPPALQHLPVLADARDSGGPLAGLCSLMAAAPSRWVLLLACDLPLLSPAVLERLVSRSHAAIQIDAVAYAERPADASPPSASLLHACCALYHSRVLPIARRELGANKGSLQNLLRAVRLVRLDPDLVTARQLSNVNTPVDLANVLTEFGGRLLAK